MAKSSLHSCGTCTPDAEGQTDCAVCKLAFLSEAKKNAEKRKEKKKTSPSIDDDDYSISERLTENRGDHTIWILFLVGVLVFVATVLFCKMLR